MVVACCNYKFGGTEGVSMSMYTDCWLLLVLGLLLLLERATATQHYSCSTHCMIAARFVGAESADCRATVGFREFVLA